VSKRKNKLKSFTQTSDGSYDRHFYQIVFKNGSIKTFDDYEQVRATYFYAHQLSIQPDHVIVCDAVQY